MIGQVKTETLSVDRETKGMEQNGISKNEVNQEIAINDCCVRLKKLLEKKITNTEHYYQTILTAKT